MAAKAKGEKGLSRRVANLEREVRAMTREAPARPEDRIARQAMPNHRASVEADLARLQGRSRNDLVSDAQR
jgi:hypothetical protein